MSLDDRTWQSIVTFLRQQPDVYVGQEAACRQFIEAVLWMTRSGAQWRLLPSSYGNWNSVYQRYNHWSKRGIWQRMQQAFVEFADLENLLMDSTTVRAHACAAGPKKGD
jgi:transposase